MATLLGSATLSTAFTVATDRVILQSFDQNKVSQTDYRPPVNAYNKDTVTDTSARLYNDAVEDYVGTDYTNVPYVSETEDFVEIVRTSSSPSSLGTNTIFCHFDLLDIDPAATINSIEVQVTVESSQSGFTTYSPYGTQDALHFGKIKCNWQDAGPLDSTKVESTPTNNGSNSYSLGDAYRIGSSNQETATFTFPTLTLGTLPTLEVVFTGVQNPGDTYPGSASLNIKIYNIRLRVNYTGRTRFTTGFQSRHHNGHPFTNIQVGPSPAATVTATGYKWFSDTTDSTPSYPNANYKTIIQSTDDLGFSSLLPSDASVDGVAIQYGLIDYRNSAGTYSAGTGTETSNAYTLADGRDNNAIQLTHGTGSTFDLVNSDYIDEVSNTYIKYRPYTSITDEPLTWYAEDADNSLGVTRAQAVTENFGIKWQPSATGASYVSGAGTTALPTGITKPNSFDYAGISPDTVKYAINIAYNPPFIAGDIAINTAVTVSATAVQIHGNTADEIDDFTTAVSLSALGGFKLEGAPQTQSTAVTTTLGTAGLTRTNHTIAVNPAFGVSVTAINDISGSALTFPTATVSVSATVQRTTPATISTALTTVLGTAGRIRTGFNVAITWVATQPTIADADLLVIQAPADSQIFVADEQTRTYLIPEQSRTHTMEAETRTYVIPAEGVDRAHLRTHTIDEQTRSINIEDIA